jgi:predicted aconitase/predicted aconitase with swiveling domain
MQDVTSTHCSVDGRALIAGEAEGELLFSAIGLSFWGGVDPATGIVIDHHHPLAGEVIAGRILAIPRGRGSCSGSGVLLELLLNGRAPAAIIVCETEEILTLGALVAEVMFEKSIPLLKIAREAFNRLGRYRFARVVGNRLELSTLERPPVESAQAPSAPSTTGAGVVQLAPIDREMLAGRHGKACEVAMRLVVKIAEIQDASRLIDVSQVHIDGCIYTGRAGLRLAETLREWGARVRVPTTLNAISVDRRRWRALGVDEALGEPASALADAYVAIGAAPSFTCAPYLLDTAPRFGEQIGWAESNAVVYANSVLGARTLKVPDFLDVCIALTGRAPEAGCHLDAGRRATVAINVAWPAGADDAFWPLVGYCCGSLCGEEIPLIRGLAASGAGADELKALGAAFATVAAAPMYHMAGVTPEADRQAPGRSLSVGLADLASAWESLNAADEETIDLVSLGNPHFSLSEFARLAGLVEGRTRSAAVSVVITCSRRIHREAAEAGFIRAVEAFGATILTDTCWCMIGEPIVPRSARTLMTNSAKYAHYAPGLVGRKVRFGSLEACVEAARSGLSPRERPGWLRDGGSL